jgi:hypothetical protein
VALRDEEVTGQGTLTALDRSYWRESRPRTAIGEATRFKLVESFWSRETCWDTVLSALR